MPTDPEQPQPVAVVFTAECNNPFNPLQSRG